MEYTRGKVPFGCVSHKPCCLRPVFTSASIVQDVEFLNKESVKSVAAILPNTLLTPLSLLERERFVLVQTFIVAKEQ